MKRLWITVAAIVGAGLIIIGLLLLGPKPPIPGSIKRQVGFTLLVPQGSGVEVDRESVQYNSQLKLLTYTLRAVGTSFVVSEQATPDSFTDTSDGFSDMVEHMEEYDKFDSELGAVHLTRPLDLKGRQASVINAKGTMMFMKPAQDLKKDQWRQVYRTLSIVK